MERGKYDQAETLLREVLRTRTAVNGPDHRDTLGSKFMLGSLYRAQRKYDQAVPMLQEVVAASKTSRGEGHPYTLGAEHQLGMAYRDWGKVDPALRLFEELLAKCRESLPPDDLTDYVRNDLARTYLAAKRPEKAVRLLEGVLAERQKHLGVDDPRTLEAMDHLARTLLGARQPGKALPLVGEYLDRQAKRLGAESEAFAALLARSSGVLLAHELYPEAEKHLRLCLAIRAREGPEAWTTFNARSMLGAALLGQKKYVEAEPLLVAGYEGLKDRQKDIPPHGSDNLPRAGRQLTLLYEATGRPAKAAAVRAELPREVAPHPRRSK
jgi:tetratricopeptide (TPR) repeat protein